MLFNFAEDPEEGNRTNARAEGWQVLGIEELAATFYEPARAEEGDQDEEQRHD